MDKSKDVYLVIQTKPKLDIFGCVEKKSLLKNVKGCEFKFLKVPLFLYKDSKNDDDKNIFDKLRDFDFFEL